MRDISIGDEVVVRGTGEHGRVRDISALYAEVILNGSQLVTLPRADLDLAGEEAP